MSPAASVRASRQAIGALAPATPRTAPTRSRLRVVPPHRPNPSKHAFVIVIGGLLFAGLVALLALNTVLAQNAFVLHDLESRSADLQAREQSLQQDVAELAAPQRLAETARALGMVTSENPAFIRPGDRA